MDVRTLFSPESGHDHAWSRYTALDEVGLSPGEVMGLARFPEERLYYFTDGRGLMDIYPGDQYEIRQNTALWTTPMIPTEIRNTGPRALHFAVFRVAGVPVPEAADSTLTLTAVDAAGQALPGSGQRTIYVYETPRHEQGLHLRSHLIPLRRSQRTKDPAELVTLLAGSSTQPHTHPDVEETIYVLSGTGIAEWDGERVPIRPGTALCYPRDVRRRVENTGDCPLTYVCHSASVDWTNEFEPLLEVATEAETDAEDHVVSRIGDVVIREPVGGT